MGLSGKEMLKTALRALRRGEYQVAQAWAACAAWQLSRENQARMNNGEKWKGGIDGISKNHDRHSCRYRIYGVYRRWVDRIISF